MNDIPELERILFFAGQLLTASDLTTLDVNNTELRWLHNRTLHNWGIGAGLDVQGTVGGTFVTVAPGYAIDSEGREIILSDTLQVPIPTVSGPSTYYLVANYVPDNGQSVEERRDAAGCGCQSTCACSSSGSVRLSNDPAILWKTSVQLKTGIDVLLAQVWIQNCVLSLKPSAAVRRYATCGSAFSIKASLADNITWLPWTLSGSPVGFTAAIDTSVAKFQAAPRYMAQIVGPRSLPDANFIVLDFVSITDETPTSFTLQLALPTLGNLVNPPAVTDPFKGPVLLHQLGWQVSWVGVEG
jgi:hypothetical protein